MNAIKVSFNNEQEEKVLISFLESLNYNYEPEFADDEMRQIKKALERSKADSEPGKVYSHKEVMASVRARLNL